MRFNSNRLLRRKDFFSLLNFRRDKGVILHRRCKAHGLFRDRTGRVSGANLRVKAHPLLFLLLIRIVRDRAQVLRPSIFLITYPHRQPTYPMTISIRNRRVRFYGAKKYSPPRRRAEVTLQRLFVASVLGLSVVFFHLINAEHANRRDWTRHVRGNELAYSHEPKGDGSPN